MPYKMQSSSQYCQRGVQAPANLPIERTNSILRNQGKNSLDPTERLPAELSVQCIQDALYASGAYASKILELTSVSKGWQAFLFSTCVLWAEIHINWLEQDLLATIAIFLHNSDEVPLFLTIWDHPESKWQEVEQLLRPHATRIRRVDFKGIHRTATFAFVPPIINSLNRLLTLKKIDFSTHCRLEDLKILECLSIHIIGKQPPSPWKPVQTSQLSGQIELYPIILSSMDAIPLLQKLMVPNVLSLGMTKGAFCRAATFLLFPHLCKLHILPDASEMNIMVTSETFPELRELEVKFYGPLATLEVLSLSSLESITLSSGSLMNCQGNILCVELLYHPKGCPSLRCLHFRSFVEWDLLYLMLERRNSGIPGVKMIDKVTLPFIPSELKPSFDLTLEGRSTERPSNVKLSLEGTREVLLDPTVPGCSYCLKNMRPGCQKAVKLFPVPMYRVVLPEFGEPPSTAPPAIHEWMTERKLLVQKWGESVKYFEKGSFRPVSCARYR